MIEELERRAREEFGDGPETVLDYASHWVASGHTLTELADELSVALKTTIHRQTLSAYLNELGGPERLVQAREEGAHALIERSLIRARAVPENRDAIQKARLVIDTEQWLAGRWNKRELGEQKGANLTVLNLGQLHIEALRAFGRQQVAEPDAVCVIPAEAESVPPDAA